MRRFNYIAALLLTASSAAQAEIIEIQWSSAGRFEKNIVVQPGKFAELCGKLGKDAKIAWSFQSDGPVNFNIHYHEGENVSYPVKQTGSTAAEGLLEVSQPQDYCWMWSNKGAVKASMKLVLQK